ncbi:RNA cap guanine-N2 methyltransferase [Kalmanozyma brasiliensis GHG001]|uniref:Trimethylguanosine synthase n=1 Tax=Kalmanozyma brasiliensis (strain GHG001) TaxID=1365824 RepID=V5F3M1_KALBG|nr:RNA cap guanine-N2 methyltransferase [Kalmanozyma brasiliensis GHG001]EST10129.1 RNA cap guanine-N2 methyltransferase [Kalmanozyma brasiliensis GHG001]
MTKKRKRTSVASFVSQLDPTSPRKHNLSAYHPDLDFSTFSPSSLALYTSLLPHCLVHPSSFPPKLLKYWYQRYTLFTLYAAGCLLDAESWFSVTPESVAFRIAKRCACDGTVVDLFAGAGGNAIQLAMTCGKVIAVEMDETRLKLARWNASVYGVEERIAFVRGDSLELMKTLRRWREKGGEEEGQEEVWNGLKASELKAVEAVFLSPPWGGVDYAQSSQREHLGTSKAREGEYDLSSVQPIHGADLFHQVHKAFNTSNIAYYLPRNTSLQQLSDLTTSLDPPQPPVRIEYQYVNHGTKLSSLTAYYGALAAEWDDELDDWRKTPTTA